MLHKIIKTKKGKSSGKNWALFALVLLLLVGGLFFVSQYFGLWGLDWWDSYNWARVFQDPNWPKTDAEGNFVHLSVSRTTVNCGENFTKYINTSFTDPACAYGWNYNNLGWAASYPFKINGHLHNTTQAFNSAGSYALKAACGTNKNNVLVSPTVNIIVVCNNGNGGDQGGDDGQPDNDTQPLQDCATVLNPTSQADCDNKYCPAWSTCKFYPATVYSIPRCGCLDEMGEGGNGDGSGLTCTDTDGGYTLGVAGTCTEGTNSYVEQCSPYDSTHWVEETWCNELGYCVGASVQCTGPTHCVKGACTIGSI